MSSNLPPGTSGETAVVSHAPTAEAKYKAAKQKAFELQLEGKMKESEPYFLRALQFRNSSITAADVGIVRESNKDYQGARAAYSLALKFEPGWWWPLQKLADLDMWEENYQRAAHYMRQVLVSKPDQVETVSKLGWLYLNKTGDFLKAEKLYRLLLQREPKDASLHLAVANSLLRQGKKQLATVYAKQALKLGYQKEDSVFNALKLK